MKRKYDKCDKRCYPTRVIAKKRLKAIKKKYKNRSEKNVYYCKKCDAWHLTSMTRQKSINLDNWKNKNLEI